MSVSGISPAEDVGRTFSPVPRHSAVSTASDTSRVWLYPKEHGAYAILGVPLIVAMLIVGLTPLTLLFSIASVCAFLAHEPMLILTGGRGHRARMATPQARPLLIRRLIVAVSCGLLAFTLSLPLAQAGMSLCLLFASIEVAVAATGKSRTLAAQLIGLAGLTLPSAVLLTIGGLEIEVASQFWLIWFSGRVATTASVRTVIARHRKNISASHTARVCDALLVAVIMICGGGMLVGTQQWLITIPLLVSAVVLRTLSPHPRCLKQVGWSLLAVNVLSGVLQLWIW